MTPAIVQLLEQCSLRLLGPNGWQGTGFFVLPGIAVTCAHVVRTERIGSESIIVEWRDLEYTGVLHSLDPNPCPDEDVFPDVAVLEVRKPGSSCAIDDSPYVPLDDDCDIGDQLYSFGFPRGKPGGDSITALCEGRSRYGSRPDQEFLKFKHAQVIRGSSGAPLLNLRTGKVCGMIKRTRGEQTELGGLAIRVPAIRKHLLSLPFGGRLLEIRNEAWANFLRTTVSLPAAPLRRDVVTGRISSLQSLLEALPSTSGPLFGRDPELTLLDSWFLNRSASMVVLHAFGGVGKTALVRHWLQSRFEAGGFEAKRFLGCSFFSQGTRERAGTSDQFLFDALKLLGDPDPRKGSLWARAKRLAELLSAEPTVLVLDGLEPLQYGSSNTSEPGALKDPGIRELLERLASSPGQAFCVVTTRFPVTGISLNDSNCVQHSLELLGDDASRELLRHRGLQGTDAELGRVARHLSNHALALILAAEYLNVFCNGDPNRIHEIPLINEETRAGRHAKSVMEAYEVAFRNSGRHLETELLLLLGLFDRPIPWSWLKVVSVAPPIAGIEAIAIATDVEMIQTLAGLKGLGLVSDEPSTGRLDAHPLVAEFFGAHFRSRAPEGWKEANRRLYEYLRDTSAATPANAAEIEPLLLAVTHGCRAGCYSSALSDVFIPRIMRGEESFTVEKLNLAGPVLIVLSHFFEPRSWTSPRARSADVPDGLNVDQQLYVLAQAAYLLSALRGYAYAEIEAVSAAARPLLSEARDQRSVFQLSYSVWRYNSGRANLTESLGNAGDLLRLAHSSGNAMQAVAANRSLATTFFRLARYEEALTCARAASASNPQGNVPAYIGDDPELNCRLLAANSLWRLGSPNEAAALHSAALRDAETRAAPHAHAVALYLGAYVSDSLERYSDSLSNAERMIAIASEYGFRWWLAAGLIRRGWAVSMLGPDARSGLSDIRQGMELWNSSGARIGSPYWALMLGEVHAKNANYLDAIASVDEAIRFTTTTGERWVVPALHRLRGQLLEGLHRDPALIFAAYSNAMDVSDHCNDRSMLLRSVVSLARYLSSVGQLETRRQALLTKIETYPEKATSAEHREALQILGVGINQ